MLLIETLKYLYYPTILMNRSKLSYVQLILSGIAIILTVSKNLNSMTHDIIPIKNDNVKASSVEELDPKDMYIFIKRPHDFYINVDVVLRKFFMIEKDKIIFETYIALGYKGYDKVKLGDNRTPLGEYYICDTRKSNGYHRFLQISYPSINDAKRGLKTGLINQQQYDRIVDANKKGLCPPSNTKLGGFIGIHAEHETWPRFYNTDWTYGCVGVDSKVISQIERKIRDKTRKGKRVPIYIHE